MLKGPLLELVHVPRVMYPYSYRSMILQVQILESFVSFHFNCPLALLSSVLSGMGSRTPAIFLDDNYEEHCSLLSVLMYRAWQIYHCSRHGSSNSLQTNSCVREDKLTGW